MVDLLSLTRDELQDLVQSWGAPRYRADQIWHWLYRGLAQSPDEMTNLPAALRARLLAETTIGGLEPTHRVDAEDGETSKVLLRLADGATIEAVLMHYGTADVAEGGSERHTVCASSQVGCAIGCAFCATGRQGWTRDLTVGEISGQVLHFERELRRERAHVTNVVFMGMGEPMLNRDAVGRAIRNLNDPKGLGLGARRFTVSTAGIVPGILAMAEEMPSVGLAVSLHAPDDVLRDELVPINRRYPLLALLEACRRHVESTGRRVTMEYTMIMGVNDSDGHARRMADLLRGLLCHVNLIPLNPIEGCGFQPSSVERVRRFRDILRRAGIPVTVRLRRGTDLRAGCGQLRSARGAERNETPYSVPQAEVTALASATLEQEQHAHGVTPDGAHRAVDSVR